MVAEGSGTHLSTATTGSQEGKDGVRKGQTRWGKETPKLHPRRSTETAGITLRETDTGDKPTRTSTNTLFGVRVERPGGDALADGGLHPAVREGSRG